MSVDYDTFDQVPTCVRKGCGKPIVQRSGESRPAWLKRRYCCAGCYEARLVIGPTRTRLELPPKHCKNPDCAALLVRRDGEDAADWRRRKYCNPDCYRATVSNLVATNRKKSLIEQAVSDGDWSWLDRAGCKGLDPDRFFPDTSPIEELERLAVRVCGPCPVKRFCAPQRRNDRYGLRAGVLYRQVAGKTEREDLLGAALRQVVAS